MRSVLLLNASYEYLNIVSWRRAFALVLSGRASVVSDWHDHSQIASSTQTHVLPAVIRLVTYVFVPQLAQAPTVNRENVFRRDNSLCLYCGKKFARTSLSIDHVLATSRGGKHIWPNVATACRRCNHRKGNKTPAEAGMSLLYKPYTPRSKAVLLLQPDTTPHEWHPFIGYLFHPGQTNAAAAQGA